MREIIIDNTDEKSIITLVENSIVTEKYEEDFNKKKNRRKYLFRKNTKSTSWITSCFCRYRK